MAATLVLVLAQTGLAAAKPAALGADFAAGTLLAAGAGAADMGAPSVTVARVTAERLAHRNARRALAREALGLRASGRETIGERLGCTADAGGADFAPPCKDKAALARLEAAVAAEAESEAVQYFSDGAVKLRARVSLEVVRGALAPRDAADPPQAGGSGPTALIIDASGLGAEWGVLPVLRAGAVSLAGPVAYAASAKAAAADPRVGARAIKLKAKAATGADVTLEATEAERLTAAQKSGALVVIIGAGKRK